MSRLFFLYLLLLFLRPQEIFPALHGFPILQIVLAACLVLWVVGSDKELFLPPIILAGALFVFIPLTVGLNGWWGGVPAAIGIIGPVFAIFLVATKAARELKALHAYMWAIVSCACLLTGYSMEQLSTGSGPLTGIAPLQGRPYFVGIFNDPNDLGQLFVVGLAFAIYLLQIARSTSLKILLFAAVSWMFYGTILSNSRGALMAALAILGLEAWRRYGKFAASLGAALAVSALYALTRLSEVAAGESSAYGRIEAWYQGIQMLRSSPLYGVGFGNFTEHNELTAHNFIVLPMAELGMLGFVLWVGIVSYALRMLWWVGFGPHSVTGTPHHETAGGEIAAARGLLLAFAGFVVSAFFLSQSYKVMLFLLCGFAIARYVTARKTLPDAPGYLLRKDLFGIVGISVACVAGIYVLVKLAI